MKTKANRLLVIAFVVVILLFLLFGGRAITGGMMNNGMNRSGWMSGRGWMWIPALFTLGLGVILGCIIFKKRVG